MTGYAFHPEALADIEELWDYIADGNIDAADRVVADIFAALRTLVASPHIGHRRPDLTARPAEPCGDDIPRDGDVGARVKPTRDGESANLDSDPDGGATPMAAPAATPKVHVIVDPLIDDE